MKRKIRFGWAACFFCLWLGSNESKAVIPEPFLNKLNSIFLPATPASSSQAQDQKEQARKEEQVEQGARFATEALRYQAVPPALETTKQNMLTALKQLSGKNKGASDDSVPMETDELDSLRADLTAYFLEHKPKGIKSISPETVANITSYLNPQERLRLGATDKSYCEMSTDSYLVNVSLLGVKGEEVSEVRTVFSSLLVAQGTFSPSENKVFVTFQ